MRQIKSFFTILCFFIFGFGGLIIGCVVFPFIMLCYPQKKQKTLFLKVVRASWRFFVWLMSSFHLIKVNVKNKERFSNLKSTVIISNHPTLIDIVILISLIPNTTCVVKGALAHNFCIKHIIKKSFLVNNDNTEEFLQKAQDFLAQGFNIVIFPEGTRTNPDKNTIHKGFAHIAIRANTPILPILITCVPKILGKGQKWYDIGHIRAQYHIIPLELIKTENSSVISEHKNAQDLKVIAIQKLFK